MWDVFVFSDKLVYGKCLDEKGKNVFGAKVDIYVESDKAGCRCKRDTWLVQPAALPLSYDNHQPSQYVLHRW